MYTMFNQLLIHFFFQIVAVSNILLQKIHYQFFFYLSSIDRNSSCCLSRADCFEVVHVRVDNALMRSSSSRFFLSCTFSRASNSMFLYRQSLLQSISLFVNSPITDIRFTVSSPMNAKHERVTSEEHGHH